MTRSSYFIRRIPAISAGLLLMWFVVAITADRVLARRAPGGALAWNAGSADANVQLASAILQSNPGAPEVLAEVRAHAMRSLGRQPINSGGARLLGLGMAGSDPVRAQRLMIYAESMSRRDLPTQMWLIETSVQRGDVKAALVHYDRALRGNGRSRVLLFPILAAAANQAVVWRPLADVLVRRPQWWRPFVEQMIPSSTSPAALYTIARRLGLDRGVTSDFALLQAIEKRLVDLGAYSQASDLYDRARGVTPGRGPLLRNGDFEMPGGWDPFDWNLIDQPDLAALRQPRPAASGGMALFLNATNGRGGDVAVQLMTLPPGTYRVGASVGAVRGDKLAFPQLVVRCARDGREVLRAAFPPAPDKGARWQTNLAIPAGCLAQRMVIQASSALNPPEMMPWIDDVAVRPWKAL